MRFREITLRDTPSIFEIRIATNENNFTYEELEARGVTHHLLGRKLQSSCKGWLCEENNEIIGFVIADKKTANIWALAVLPTSRKKEISTRLLHLADHWLLSIGRKKVNHKSNAHKECEILAVA